MTEPTDRDATDASTPPASGNRWEPVSGEALPPFPQAVPPPVPPVTAPPYSEWDESSRPGRSRWLAGIAAAALVLAGAGGYAAVRVTADDHQSPLQVDRQWQHQSPPQGEPDDGVLPAGDDDGEQLG